MSKAKTQRRLENFVQSCKLNGDPVIAAVGTTTGCFVRNIGAPEYQLLLLANLIYSFRKQAGDHWDELKANLLAIVDKMHEEDISND